MSEACHRRHVVQDDATELRHAGRKKIGSVQRRALFYQRMIGVKLRSKINPFLEIRLTGCELAANRKVSAPGSTAARHADLELRFEVSSKKLAADFLKTML